jgi:hypothetical protein
MNASMADLCLKAMEQSDCIMITLASSVTAGMEYRDYRDPVWK